MDIWASLIYFRNNILDEASSGFDCRKCVEPGEILIWETGNKTMMCNSSDG